MSQLAKVSKSKNLLEEHPAPIQIKIRSKANVTEEKGEGGG